MMKQWFRPGLSVESLYFNTMSNQFFTGSPWRKKYEGPKSIFFKFHCDSNQKVKAKRIMMHLSIFFFYLSGRQRLRLTKPSDNDFTETLTHLCSVVENVSSYRHCGKQYSGFPETTNKTKNRITLWSSNPTTWMFIHRWMDKDLVHIYTGILHTKK